MRTLLFLMKHLLPLSFFTLLTLTAHATPNRHAASWERLHEAMSACKEPRIRALRAKLHATWQSAVHSSSSLPSAQSQ